MSCLTYVPSSFGHVDLGLWVCVLGQATATCAHGMAALDWGHEVACLMFHSVTGQYHDIVWGRGNIMIFPRRMVHLF